MHIIIFASLRINGPIGVERCLLMSTLWLWQIIIASAEAWFGIRFSVPAELISICLVNFDFSKSFFKTPSAIGDRHILPEQINVITNLLFIELKISILIFCSISSLRISPSLTRIGGEVVRSTTDDPFNENTGPLSRNRSTSSANFSKISLVSSILGS